MTARTTNALPFAMGLAALASALVIAPRAARAQVDVQVKPHLLFAIDTSGSMREDINSRPGAVVYPNTQTHSPSANSCGVTFRSRVNDVRCVMSNVINNVSDAVIGLARFRNTSAACSTYNGGTSGTPITQCGDSGDNNTFCRGTDAMQLLYPLIDTGIAPPMYPTNRAAIVTDQLEWFDATATTGLCTTSSSCNNSGNPDIGTDGATPLGGVLDGARIYFASGLTSVGGANDAVVDNRTVGSPITADPLAACRPRGVILLTDGDETCSGNAPARAADLLNLTVGGQARPVRTYPIAMGTAIPYAPIEAIATSGGTDARGPNRGYYANSEAEIAVAISDIIASAQLREYCNGVDDNCNTLVDEGYNLGASCTAGVGACLRTGTLVCAPGPNSTSSVCNATAGTPGAENTNALCSDGIDNDCDGLIDCADPNCAAALRCGGCVPTAEICNGRDDDCDGVADNGNPGGGTACGLTLGDCRAGTTACVSGGIVCQGAVGPTTEVCDGRDNNCNGAVDEGITQACGNMVGECRPGIQRCVNGSFTGQPCVGAVGPTTEVCDTRDNNCNGTSDEGNPGGGATCGTSTGACRPGIVTCAGGALTCVGGVLPSPEVCDGIDNDCNGLTDDGVMGGGMACTPSGVTFPTDPPMAPCRRGATVCRAGALVCDGAVGPGTETCNGIDDNCNGTIDEGLAGGPCGSMVGICRPGTLRCSMGRSVCDGGVMPGTEVCNGLDDDCDGEVDEGNPGGGTPCGSNVGECAPGVNVCRGGMLVCDGGRGPMTEVCNGLDDNCNGSVDEGITLGAACGSTVGECRQGTERCVAGRVVCEGGVAPRPEECDCRDNDCDGMVDNTATGGSPLCGGGAVCAGSPHCQCLRPCEGGEFPCPIGRQCASVMGQDLCIGDTCLGVTCDLATATCVNGACRPRCEGVTCDAPLVCNPANGRCVSNSCRVLQNCPTGQICREERCQVNPCNGVTCPDSQACYNGTCGVSCAGVTCPSGQSCFQGVCQADRCATASCTLGMTCNPADGACVPNRCTNRSCGRDLACDPLTGDCVDDQCVVTHCPAGQTCTRGSCSAAARPPGPARERVIGSGGGGLACAVGNTQGRTRGPGGLALAALGAVAVSLGSRQRRRRNTRRAGEVQS